MATIDVQDTNYLTRLENAASAYLRAYQALEDVVQEAYDRGVDDRRLNWDYPLPGDISHITADKLVSFLGGFQAVKSTMTADGRLVFADMYGIIR